MHAGAAGGAPDPVSAAPERLRSRARHGRPGFRPARPPVGGLPAAASDALGGGRRQAAAPHRLYDAAQHLDDLFGRHVGR